MKCPGAWAGLNGGRYLLQGTTENIGPGVNMVGKVNASGLCNYIGVDSGATGNGTLCVLDGGTLITPFITPYENGANTVVFDGGTLTFTGTTLELAGKPSGHYVFARATGNGTFSGVPSLDVKGYSIRLSSDRKRVVVVRKGLTIIVR